MRIRDWKGNKSDKDSICGYRGEKKMHHRGWYSSVDRKEHKKPHHILEPEQRVAEDGTRRIIFS